MLNVIISVDKVSLLKTNSSQAPLSSPSTRPQPWPLKTWTNSNLVSYSSRLHPYNDSNSAESACWRKFKAAKEVTIPAHTWRWGPCLPASVGGQEPNFDNSQLTKLDGFHMDQPPSCFLWFFTSFPVLSPSALPPYSLILPLKCPVTCVQLEVVFTPASFPYCNSILQ